MDRIELTQFVRQCATDLGFTGVGISTVSEIPPERLEQWLELGYQGTMSYMERNLDRRLDPGLLVPGARTILSLGLNYYHPIDEDRGDSIRALISRYARGRDYHKVIKKRLVSLLRRLQSEIPGTEGRVFVDTGPVMDKYWAAQGGLGWLGKNANVISRKGGSWFFLGEVILNLELEPDVPGRDYCGSCTRCIEACPTDAIVEPYVVDSRRCISYLTIELRGDIPAETRPRMGNLVFGCDICQDVCPWNGKPVQSLVDDFRDPGRNLDLTFLAGLSEDEFNRLFEGSPVRRAKWNGFLRNVAVAMGNSRRRECIQPLRKLASSQDEMVRRHALWAISALEASLGRETGDCQGASAKDGD